MELGTSVTISRFGRMLSASLMIAGTAIGAGMLAIPLVTTAAGFFPAFLVTLLVWLFMLATGFLFLEVSLWMPDGANILTMSSRLLGARGKWLAGSMFLFLYLCLMVAYFAAGAPLFTSLLGLPLAGWGSFLLYGAIFGTVVALGARMIDRTNMVLTIALVVSFVLLIGKGGAEVTHSLLLRTEWSASLLAIPVLFSAFGYHNVIPSLSSYLQKDRRLLSGALLIGTALAFLIYLIWQWLMIGSISPEALLEAKLAGKTATEALQAVVGNPSIYRIGQVFAFFAIATSMLGVAFSLVDFLSDAFRWERRGAKRIWITLLTFGIPCCLAALNPTIFDRALGYAGGFGEAFLNGLLPVCLVWMGRYRQGITGAWRFVGGKSLLLFLMAASLFVIGLETYLAIH